MTAATYTVTLSPADVPVSRELTGHYEPNAPYAPGVRRTLANARPLYVGNERVTVQVEGRTAYLFVGCTYDIGRELPADMTRDDVNGWAQRMIAEGYTGEPREVHGVCGHCGGPSVVHRETLAGEVQGLCHDHVGDGFQTPSAEIIAAATETNTAIARVLRKDVRRHAYNMRRATTARAQNRNAEKLADAEHELNRATSRLAVLETAAAVRLLAAVLDTPATTDAPATTAEMVAAVKAHALAPENYNAGWDGVAECYDDAEIAEVLEESGATTVAAALEAFGTLVDVWEDRRKTADHMFRY